MAIRAASIWRFVTYARVVACRPHSPKATSVPPLAIPLRLGRCCLRYFTRRGISISPCLLERLRVHPVGRRRADVVIHRVRHDHHGLMAELLPVLPIPCQSGLRGKSILARRYGRMWSWLRTDQTQYGRAGCAVAHDLHGRTRYGPYQHRPVGRIPEYGYLLRLRALPTGWNDALHGGMPHVR